MMTSLNLVAAGMGLTVVPASMMGTHERAIAYRELPRGAKLDAPLTLLHRADRHQGALASFVTLVAELADSLTSLGRPVRGGRRHVPQKST